MNNKTKIFLIVLVVLLAIGFLTLRLIKKTDAHEVDITSMNISGGEPEPDESLRLAGKEDVIVYIPEIEPKDYWDLITKEPSDPLELEVYKKIFDSSLRANLSPIANAEPEKLTPGSEEGDIARDLLKQECPHSEIAKWYDGNCIRYHKDNYNSNFE